MQTDDDVQESAPFELAATMVAVVAAGFAAAWLFSGAESFARALVMAGATAVLATWVADRRVCVTVVVVSALVYVGFLTHRYAVLTGDPEPWSYTPLIAFAALLGRGRRWMKAAAPAGEGASPKMLPSSTRVLEGVQESHPVQRLSTITGG
ncbi:hypothetical protein [Winogradskya humida]|uniref:Uncharacterized protein n=1 Tax=Winogradskya humida TaxID=113566 RepID=A0ABQ3ZWF2_9ACTN|nr:hypothetical protein [Actinoplanes humidus]GIE22941.1 hypothetical protein Ahu01nite_060430 [Actinoplanes humidus]